MSILEFRKGQYLDLYYLIYMLQTWQATVSTSHVNFGVPQGSILDLDYFIFMLQTWQATVSTAAVRKYKVISVDLETGLQTQTLYLM